MKKRGRKATVDPLHIVALIRAGHMPSVIAKDFGVSRVRVSQILEYYAPELRKTRGPRTLTPEQLASRVEERAELVRILNAFDTHRAAAKHLKLTEAGLYNRMRKYGIKYNVIAD